MLDIIARLEKEYDIKLDEFLKHYEQGVGRETMCDLLGTTTHKIRVYAASLGLRWAKKHREGDLILLKKKIDNSDVNNTDVVCELIDDLDLVSENLVKFHKKLVNCRDENTILRRQIRENARKEVSESRIINALKQELDEIEINVKQVVINYENNLVKGTTILALSDLHYGLKVESEDIGDLNEFNIEIANKRMSYIFDKILKNKIKTDRLIISLGGDLLDGLIHNSDLVADVPVTQAIVELVKSLNENIRKIEKNFGKIEVVIVSGNHERGKETPAIHKKGYDYTHLFSELFKSTLNDLSKVKVNYSINGFGLFMIGEEQFEDFYFHKIYGVVFHGDNQRSYKTHNLNEVLKVQEQVRQIYKVEPKLLLSGHTHTYSKSLLPNGGVALTTGSFCGTNAYSYVNGFVNTPPSQSILYYNNLGELVFEDLVVLDKVG